MKFFVWLLVAIPTLCISQNLEYRQKIENSFIIHKNKNSFIPLQKLNQNKFCLLGFDEKTKIFEQSFIRYTNLVELDKANTFIFLIKNQNELSLFDEQFPHRNKHFIAIIFANTDTNLIAQAKSFADVVISSKYNDSLTYDYAAQLLFGAFENLRFKYTIPTEVGIDSAYLFSKIDSIVDFAIRNRAFAGCQIFAAIDHKVIFHKSYGYTTYDSTIKVDNFHLYDLASITKIAASAIALMYLFENNKFLLDDKISKHLKIFKKTNKADITFVDALTHQAGLTPFIPFWKNFVDSSSNLNTDMFKTVHNRKFPIEVAQDIYCSRTVPEIVYHKILNSKLLEQKVYRYSDLFFYFVPQLVKTKTHYNIDNLLEKKFYKPVGSVSLCFKPLSHYDKTKIVPTEYDSLFRKQLLWGYVHDEGAALLGGISGHAGLFGNSNDLAKLMQMLMNYGIYGGERYLDSSIVKQWTSYVFADSSNHRGICFDKPLFKDKTKQTASTMASQSSFGHSGFTGTFVWADPQYKFVFVFLSNRVYPTRKNNNLIKFNIRTQIHNVFYEQLTKTK